MTTTRRRARTLLAVAALGLLTMACTPEEIAMFNEGINRTYGKHHHVLSDAGLARLRECESTRNYRAVSSRGTYRGAYQFSQSTWNGVAARHYPWLQGVDPAAAHPWEQDAMARALWAESGRSPWPHCGRRV